MGTSTSIPVRLVALGGLGEIGLNLMALEFGEDTLLIDAGVMFPEERWLGVDVIVPELAYLATGRRKLRGVVLTHAHEDHIGALPFLLKRFRMPVFGSELTLAFARRRLQDRGVSIDNLELKAIEPRRPFRLGPFEVEPLRVTHSTPDSLALAIDTPAGLIVHSGDFKIDDAPVDGVRFDRDRFAELGARGVTLLLSDSTNVERPGRAASESSLKPLLRDLASRTRGRFFLSAFSSHLHRVRQVAEVSREFGRRVVPLGRSMVDSTRLGVEYGHLRFPPGTFVDPAEAAFLEPNRLTFLTSGSQGEPLSALVKIATDSHPRVRVEPNDTVVLASRFIPGNERTINTLINHLYKRGAEVFYEPVAAVHVSGHACQDELSELIRLTQPRYFVPIHGEYRHLARHIALAAEAGIPASRCFLLEDGDTLALTAGVASRARPVEAGRVSVVVDGGAGDVDLLRERQALAREGTVMAVIAVAEDSGRIVAGPDLISRGLISGNGASPEIARARFELKERLDSVGAGLSTEQLRGEVIRTLRRYFNDELGARPEIVPCVVEIKATP